MLTSWNALLIVWTLTGSPENDSFDFAVATFATEQECRAIYADHCFQTFGGKHPPRR